ncbi:MAG: hypothetical protein WBG92_08085 [Thiohalocapsa sp.]
MTALHGLLVPLIALFALASVSYAEQQDTEFPPAPNFPVGLQGRVLHEIGAEAGFEDGSLAAARFRGPRGLMFGDGGLLESTFSQPSGLALRDGKLYVADAEASAIREIDLRGDRVRSLLGNGEPGGGDGAVDRLKEPGGLAVVGSRILIADTNDSRILAYVPETGVSEVWTPTR